MKPTKLTGGSKGQNKRYIFPGVMDRLRQDITFIEHNRIDLECWIEPIYITDATSLLGDIERAGRLPQEEARKLEERALLLHTNLEDFKRLKLKRRSP